MPFRDEDGKDVGQQWKLAPGETLSFYTKPVYIGKAVADTAGTEINMGLFDSEEEFKKACAELEANLRDASENNRYLVSQAYVDARGADLIPVDPDSPKASRGSN